MNETDLNDVMKLGEMLEELDKLPHKNVETRVDDIFTCQGIIKNGFSGDIFSVEAKVNYPFVMDGVVEVEAREAEISTTDFIKVLNLCNDFGMDPKTNGNISLVIGFHNVSVLDVQ